MDQSKGGSLQERTEIQITRDKAIRLGIELGAVMKTEGFKTALEVLQHEYQTRVFNSAPHEREARELAYQEARALDNLIATLNTFVAVAEHESLKSLVFDEDEHDEITLSI